GVDRVCRPEPDDAARPQPLLGDDPVEQGQRVAMEVAGRRADLRILQDRRVRPAELPGGAERRPGAALDQLAERVRIEGSDAEERRYRRLDAGPLDREAIGAG